MAGPGFHFKEATANNQRSAFDKMRGVMLSELANCESAMTAAAHARYKTQARIIKALAHPTRLFIVDELSRGERCVCELTAMIGVEMPTVSRHLSQLKNVGILVDEKRGSQVFYRLRVPCVLKFFSCVEAVQKNGNGT